MNESSVLVLIRSLCFFSVPSPIKLAQRDATTAKVMKPIFRAEMDAFISLQLVSRNIKYN